MSSLSNYFPSVIHLFSDTQRFSEEVTSFEALEQTLNILANLLKILAELNEIIKSYSKVKRTEDATADDAHEEVHSKVDDGQEKPEKRKKVLVLYPIINREQERANNISVDFYHCERFKIYNVQAKANEVITGEVGKIDSETGQSSQGIRYTTTDGQLDQKTIMKILEKLLVDSS